VIQIFNIFSRLIYKLRKKNLQNGLIIKKQKKKKKKKKIYIYIYIIEKIIIIKIYIPIKFIKT